MTTNQETYEVVLEFPALTLYVNATNNAEAIFIANNWMDDVELTPAIRSEVDITVTTLTEMETLS